MPNSGSESVPRTQEALLRQIEAIASHDKDEIASSQRLRSLQRLALRHSIYGTSRAAPVREIMAMIGDKWTTLILSVLESGQCRYSVLRQLVSALSHESTISHRVLTAKLRLVERDGLIERRVWATVPPRVDYRLTELGKSLVQQVENLMSWAETHYDELQGARVRFDKAPPEEPATDDS